MNNKTILHTAAKGLLYASVIMSCMMLHLTPVTAITVSSTLFQGSTYNLMTDNSGNEWLSLLATDGQTYGFVETQIDNAIGDYADYRLADKNEVVALFTDYGAAHFDVGATDASFPSATALQNDFGSTGAISIGEPLTWGYTSTILVQGPNSFPSYHLSPFVRVQTGEGEAQFRTTLSVNVISDPNTHLRGSWLIRNSATLSADFDLDSDVDGTDLTLWQSSFGVGAGADTDGDGDTDGDDFLVWQRQFGSGLSPAGQVQEVPEPTSITLVLLGVFCSLLSVSGISMMA